MISALAIRAAIGEDRLVGRCNLVRCDRCGERAGPNGIDVDAAIGNRRAGTQADIAVDEAERAVRGVIVGGRMLGASRAILA